MLKPDDWMIEDMRRLRRTSEKTPAEEAYLELLLAYTRMLNESKKTQKRQAQTG